MPETIFGGALAGLQQAQETQYREALRIAQQTMQQAELAQRDKEFTLRLQDMEETRQARQDYQQEALAERARQFDERERNRREIKESELRVKREQIDADMRKYLSGLDAKSAQEQNREYYKLVLEYEKQGMGEVDARARAFAQILSADTLRPQSPGTPGGMAPPPGGPITPVPLGAPPPMPGAMQFPGAQDVGPPGQALGPRPMPPEQQQGLAQRPSFGVLPGVAENMAWKADMRALMRAREKYLAADTALTKSKTLTEDEMRALRIAKLEADTEYRQLMSQQIEALLPLEIKEKQAQLQKTYEDIAASQQKRAGGAQALTPDDVRQIQTSERGEDALIAGYRKTMQGVKNELPYIKVAIQKKQNEINRLNRAWQRDDAAIKLLEEEVKAMTEDQLAKESLLDGFQNMINGSLQRKRTYQDMLAKGGVRVPATQYGTPARGDGLPPAPVNTQGLPGFPDSQTPPGQPFWPDGRPWRGVPYATTPVVPQTQRPTERSAPPPARQTQRTQSTTRQETKKPPPAKKPPAKAAAPGFDVLNPSAGYRAGDLTLLPGARKAAPPAKKPAAKPAAKKKSVKDMTDDELFRQMMGR